MMKAFAVAALSLSLSAVPFVASAESADDAWFAQSVATAERAMAAMPAAQTTQRPVFVPMTLPIRPDATTPLPPFFANFVAAGLNAAYVPCFNCVYGVSGTLGLPAAYNVVAANSYWQYNISWSNLAYVGPCTVLHVITSGTKTLAGKSTKLTKISGAGAYDWGWVDNPVKFVGTAVLTGRVVCGKTTSTVTAKLIFQ